MPSAIGAESLAGTVSSMHNIALTPQDREVVLDYAARLEKRSRQWRVLRWLAIACFVFGVGLLVCVGHLSAKMHTTMELPREALTFPENPGPKLLASSIEMIAAHDDAQVMVLRAEVYLVLKAVIVAGVGTALFVYAVSDWRRDRRDRVISKLLRSLASSETADKDHGS